MKIYRVERDHSKTLEQQKKELKEQYKDFYYFGADGKQIDFMSSGPKDPK